MKYFHFTTFSQNIFEPYSKNNFIICILLRIWIIWWLLCELIKLFSADDCEKFILLRFVYWHLIQRLRMKIYYFDDGDDEYWIEFLLSRWGNIWAISIFGYYLTIYNFWEKYFLCEMLKCQCIFEIISFKINLKIFLKIQIKFKNS